MNRFMTPMIAASLIISTAIGLSQSSIAHPGQAHDLNIKAAVKPVAIPTPLTALPTAVPHHPELTVAIPAGQPIPSLTLNVIPDTIAGWNMQINLTNFVFNPAQVNQSSNTTEGHAHLLLNDRKVARIYGTWNHIPKLPQGQNVLKVVLMTNKHETLTSNGQPIVGQVTIDVPVVPAAKDPDAKDPDAKNPARSLNQ
jgi:hypothetical protein